MTISKNNFREALRHWASGVTVVTTKDRAGCLHGITVSAFSSVSLHPPLILICIEKGAGSHHAFIENDLFIINILSDKQEHVSRRFASHSRDKFVGIETAEGSNGIPRISGALANLECRRMLSYEGGDHTIFVGEIENSIIHPGKPLLYFNGHYGKIEKHL
ncbi:MAG: flavin reductase family protein [Pyrinomonadaceae bacterium]